MLHAVLRLAFIAAASYAAVAAVGLAILGAAWLYRRRVAQAMPRGAYLQAVWDELQAEGARRRASAAAFNRQAEVERYEQWKRDVAVARLPPIQVVREDICDLPGTPYHAIVQCIDGEAAWVQLVEIRERHSGVVSVRFKGQACVRARALAVKARGFHYLPASS